MSTKAYRWTFGILTALCALLAVVAKDYKWGLIGMAGAFNFGASIERKV